MVQPTKTLAPLVRAQRLAKGLEKCPVDRVTLRVVFSVPLYAECKAWGVGDPDCLDRAVLRHALHDDPLARLKHALAVQRIDADHLAPEQFCKGAIRDEADVMTIGEDHLGIGMDLAAFEPRHPMIHAPGQFADFGM